MLPCRLDDLTPAELESLTDWERTFNSKYEVVGKVGAQLCMLTWRALRALATGDLTNNRNERGMALPLAALPVPATIPGCAASTAAADAAGPAVAAAVPADWRPLFSAPDAARRWCPRCS